MMKDEKSNRRSSDGSLCILWFSIIHRQQEWISAENWVARFFPSFPFSYWQCFELWRHHLSLTRWIIVTTGSHWHEFCEPLSKKFGTREHFSSLWKDEKNCDRRRKWLDRKASNFEDVCLVPVPRRLMLPRNSRLPCHLRRLRSGAFRLKSRAQWRRSDDQRKKATFKESCLHNIKHQAAKAVSAIKRRR